VTDSTRQRSANRRLSLRLTVVVVAMFGFGYTILPLLYDAVCELTGLGGRPAVAQESQLSGVVDADRLVTVQFLGTVNSALPWEVRPTVTKMRIHPGRLYDATYFARNLSTNSTVGTATPTITPTKVLFQRAEVRGWRRPRDAGSIRRRGGAASGHPHDYAVLHLLQRRGAVMIASATVFKTPNYPR